MPYRDHKSVARTKQILISAFLPIEVTMLYEYISEENTLPHNENDSLPHKIREMKYQITYLKIDPEPPGPNPNKGPDNVAWNGDAPMPKFYLIPTKVAVKNLLIDGSDYKIIANKK